MMFIFYVKSFTFDLKPVRNALNFACLSFHSPPVVYLSTLNMLVLTPKLTIYPLHFVPVPSDNRSFSGILTPGPTETTATCPTSTPGNIYCHAKKGRNIDQGCNGPGKHEEIDYEIVCRE